MRSRGESHIPFPGEHDALRFQLRTPMCVYIICLYTCVCTAVRAAPFFVAVDARAQISGDQRTRTTVGVCAGSQ